MAGGRERRHHAAAATLGVKQGALFLVPMRCTIGQRSTGILPCTCVFADGTLVRTRVASRQSTLNQRLSATISSSVFSKPFGH